MAVRGAEAQAEKARCKAARREAKALETEAEAEDRRIEEAVNELVAEFRDTLTGSLNLVMGERLRRIKAERVQLRVAVEEAKKLADDRRRELDGQVERARAAEAKAKAFRGDIEKERREGKAKIARLTEIVEEQASTIKAQATALRSAEKKLRV